MFAQLTTFMHPLNIVCFVCMICFSEMGNFDKLTWCHVYRIDSLRYFYNIDIAPKGYGIFLKIDLTMSINWFLMQCLAALLEAQRALSWSHCIQCRMRRRTGIDNIMNGMKLIVCSCCWYHTLSLHSQKGSSILFHLWMFRI